MRNKTPEDSLVTLDSIDKKILETLQRNGGISNIDLADEVALSPSPCSRRVKSLEDNGYIEGYVALVNPKKLNLGLCVMVNVTLQCHESSLIHEFEKAISSMPEVVQCYLMAGQTADYCLKVFASDLDEYQSFLLNKLTKIKGVTSIQSVFILKKIVDKTELPLSHL